MKLSCDNILEAGCVPEKIKIKVLKQTTRKYKDKQYYKWVIVLPNKFVRELGIDKGNNKELILEYGRKTR